MTIQKLYKFCIRTSLAFTSFYCLVGTGLANAQSITPDATLPTPTEVTPTATGVEITGGTARDINLFHSFQEFSLLNGNEAFFNNASTISNIITRVTGGQISTIDGLISANNANLFFLNPAGILFGPNASLNIGGSFYGSTADSLIFPEGEFSATNPQAPPVLTINAPIGLGFRDNPGNITVNGSFLSVDTGETLALLGGNVTGDFGLLDASGGRIELGGLTATGTVSFNDDGSLSFPDAVPRGNVSLTNETFVLVDGEQGGSIAINANNLEVIENSILRGGTFASVGLANSQSGDIVLNATGDITVNSSRIDNAVGIGNAGNIEITGQSFSLNNGGVLTNSTFGEGNAGNITIDIDSAVNITDAIIFNNVEAGAVGDGGTVTINSGSLSLQDGGQIQALVRQEDTEAQLSGGVGSAGNIIIDVDDSVNIAGISSRTELFSAIFSFLGTGAKGSAGNIEITAGSLVLDDGGFLQNSTFGEGSPGNITLDVDNAVTLSNNGDILSEVGSNAIVPAGEVGTITINAGSFSIADGTSSISTSTLGQGDAGSVTLDINGAVDVTDGIIFSNVEAGGVGDGGTVTINSNSLSLTNGGQITASVIEENQAAQLAGGVGNAGDVIIDVDGEVNISGNDSNGNFSAIFSTLGTGAKGSAGNIEVTADSFTLSEGGFLQNGTFGEGSPGNITLDVAQAVTLSNDGDIFSEVGSNAIVPEGEVGTITINAGSFSIADGASSISTSTFGQGDAGSVTLDIDGAVDVTDGIIFSNVEAGAVGNGGTVTINSNSLSLTNGGQITASVIEENQAAQLAGGVGNAGDVIIDVDGEVNISGNDSNGNFSAIFSTLGTGAKGSAGNIEVTADSLNLESGGFLTSSTSGEGNAGSVTLDIDGAVNIISGTIFSNVEAGAVGNGGTVTINSGSLSLTNGGQITASVIEENQAAQLAGGVGNAGDVIIDVDGEVNISGNDSNGNFSAIFSTLGTGAKGSAGNIEVTADSLNLESGGFLTSSTSGEGNAGSVTLDIDGAVNIISGTIFSNVETDGVGDGGTVIINSDSLSLKDGGFLTTSTFGQGDAGNLNISANNISIDGTLSEIESDAAGEGQAGGGEIIVNTDNLTLTNGGAITAGTLGQGDAGKINITASNNISIDGKGEDGFLSGIGSEVGETATANGGGIEISTDNLLISNEGAITAATFGIGDAGIIKITADNISLNNGAQIAVDSQGAGQGGSLFIQADNLSLDNESSLLASTPIGTGGNIALDIAEVLSFKGNSLISAEATGDANGGNVNINAQFVVAFPNDGNGNDIIARAEDGVGGNVNIAAEQVFNLKEGEAIDGNSTNDIDVSSAFGLAGQVNIRTFTDDVIQGASELPRNPVEPEQTVAQACSSQGIAEGGNSFTVTGKGGVPPLPTEPMSSEVILSEGTVEAGGNLSTDSYNNSHQQPQGILTSQGYIVPAQGIVKTEDGEVILVGYSVNNINQRTPVQSPNCGKS